MKAFEPVGRWAPCGDWRGCRLAALRRVIVRNRPLMVIDGGWVAR